MFQVGQMVYRAKAPDDGGDWVPQYLTVVEAYTDTVKVRVYPNGKTYVLDDEESGELYSNKLACYKECWRRGGKPDIFEQTCARKGLHTPEEKKAELEYQMEIWGATSYDDLLSCMI